MVVSLQDGHSRDLSLQFIGGKTRRETEFVAGLPDQRLLPTPSWAPAHVPFLGTGSDTSLGLHVTREKGEVSGGAHRGCTENPLLCGRTSQGGKSLGKPLAGPWHFRNLRIFSHLLGLGHLPWLLPQLQSSLIVSSWGLYLCTALGPQVGL